MMCVWSSNVVDYARRSQQRQADTYQAARHLVIATARIVEQIDFAFVLACNFSHDSEAQSTSFRA